MSKLVEDILQMFISGAIHIPVTFEKLTNINQVSSVLKQIEFTSVHLSLVTIANVTTK